jgi:predicted ATPase/class 3 adenylate cyclase
VARGLPEGTVTFLFTDIEGSTRLLDELGAARYTQSVGKHRSLLREAFARHGGAEVDTQGDALFYAFARASDALAAAAEGQAALASGPIRVRMGVHTGEPVVTDDGYVGMDVHRGARVAAAAHGGQVVVSEATARLADTRLIDLGEHRLKDLTAPIRLFQIGGGRFPPLRTLHATNLPVQPTPLVGRERELAEVRALVAAHRLVTLVGPGGVGKTRLALQVAAEVVDDFPDGVFWVPLASLRDAELALPTVAAAVRARGELADHLREKQMLLLLDNLEHLLTCGPGLADVLRAASRVTIIVTSRERLRVSGECAYEVPPLSEADAVALFLDRAQLSGRTIKPSEAVNVLCRRLDKLPLALELAAARVRVLPPEKLLERLGKQLPLLTAGFRDLAERQRTLRATIEWSYELLSPVERQLFARLSVFAGSFNLETAEDVCDAELDSVEALVEKSLVRAEDDRFTMLETIREYALERLDESGEGDALRRRHAEHFAAIAEAAVPALEVAEQASTLTQLDSEQANFRAGLEWAESASDPELQLRMVSALWFFWYVRGAWREARRALERALEIDSATLPELRVNILHAAAWFAQRQGDLTVSEAWAEESLQLSRELADRRAGGRALRALATARGDEDMLIESEALSEQTGDRWNLMIVRNNLGDGHLLRGEYDAAAALFGEAAATARDRGDARMLALTLVNLGQAELAAGRESDSRARLVEGLQLADELGYPEMVVGAIEALAALLARVAKDRDAACLLGASERISGDLGTARIGFEQDQYERTAQLVRERLGEPAYEAAFRAGARMPREAAVNHALRAVEHGAGSGGRSATARQRGRGCAANGAEST